MNFIKTEEQVRAAYLKGLIERSLKALHETEIGPNDISWAAHRAADLVQACELLGLDEQFKESFAIVERIQKERDLRVAAHKCHEAESFLKRVAEDLGLPYEAPDEG